MHPDHTRQPCGSDAGDCGALWLFHRWATDQHLVLIDPREGAGEISAGESAQNNVWI
jgi:hypothetical protein